MNLFTIVDVNSGTIQSRLDTFANPSGNLGTDVNSSLSFIIGALTLVAGLAFIFYFMIGAINWLTSSGDTQKAGKARAMITNSLIGIIITAIAYPALYIIGNLLGIHLSNPGNVLTNLLQYIP